MTPLLTDIEAAEALGLRPQTLRNWRLQGKGPTYVQLGRAVRYRPEDLVVFIEKGRRSGELEAREGR